MLIDPKLIDEIRRIERSMGRNDVLSGFVRKLEESIAGFPAAFTAYLAKGDATGAVRAAHTLKGTSRQLGALALGDLFEHIEEAAKAGDYDGAKRKFEESASLVAESLEALRRA